MKTNVIRRMLLLRRLARQSGPYLLLEILLPGGTLFALLLFLYQRRRAGALAQQAPRFAVLPSAVASQQFVRVCRCAPVVRLLPRCVPTMRAAEDVRLAA